ncbi:MAG: zinc ribbon domain-containing protein [Candidatus Heimdallarchaeota archaeon]
MSERYVNKKGELLTYLKFIIKPTHEQLPILERTTSRHTFAIRRYLEVLEEEEFPYHFKEAELDKLTIRTRNRSQVEYDLITETGLTSTDLQSAGRTALRMWKIYLTQHKNWTRRCERIAIKSILKYQSNMELTQEGEIVYGYKGLANAVYDFAESKIWQRVVKSEPAKPTQSSNHKAKKIPMRLVTKNNLIQFMVNRELFSHKFIAGKLYIKVKTLQPKQPLKLELQYSVFHLNELERGRITGGKIVKNLKKNRWEFHAYIRRSMTYTTTENKKKVILGIDLGINNLATMVVLIEDGELKREQFHFLNERKLTERMLRIDKRKSELKRIIHAERGRKQREAMRELKNQKYGLVSNEICHRISKRIATIAESYLEANYDVHVAIGKLKGMITIVRRGSGFSKTIRGMYHKFPYGKLTEFIKHKCLKVGIREEQIQTIKENWTSKTCFKCRSTETVRPTQKNFQCKNCGLQYNADANGAINIGLRYLQTISNESLDILMLIFLQQNQTNNSSSNLLEVQRTNDTPHYTELAGDKQVLSHSKVKE